jgi:hypothetical protein
MLGQVSNLPVTGNETFFEPRPSGSGYSLLNSLRSKNLKSPAFFPLAHMLTSPQSGPSGGTNSLRIGARHPARLFFHSALRTSSPPPVHFHLTCSLAHLTPLKNVKFSEFSPLAHLLTSFPGAARRPSPSPPGWEKSGVRRVSIPRLAPFQLSLCVFALLRDPISIQSKRQSFHGAPASLTKLRSNLRRGCDFGNIIIP